MSPSADGLSPTPAQLRYLRVLAEQTATTFVSPRTRVQASREIDRLRRFREPMRPARAADEVEEQEDGSDRERLVYGTAVQPEEVSGFGSSASWRTRSSSAVRVSKRQSRVGERTELARYRVKSGERVLYGQRINGRVRITDRPLSGQGRSYLVEGELERDGYAALKALVVDYLEQGRELDDVPMASSVIRAQLQDRGSDQ
jgi:hypothetical protein